MIHFEGTEPFAQSVPQLYAKLADAGYLALALPDATVTEASPDRAVWKQRPKLAFIAGAIETTLTVANRVANQSVAFTVLGKGVGATSTVETTLGLQPDDAGGTRVRWTSDVVALTGLLKMVPKGLIQATADSIIRDVWSAVRAKIEKEATAP